MCIFNIELMDICYFLGSESQADDWEMRYSLRSWWQFFPTMGTIHIVGHLPAWLRIGAGVTHHPHQDPYRSNKDANLIQKTIYLASLLEVSDPFILCSDDQMLLRLARELELLPPSHNGEIGQFKKVAGHSWWERLHRTGAALKRRKCTTFHYDTHIPHVVSKAQARSLLQWNFGEGNGYCVFSLLFNGSGALGARIDRAPIRAGLYGADTPPHIVRQKLANNLFLSIDGDSLRNRTLVEEVEARFPIAAPWETYLPRSATKFENLYPRLATAPSEVSPILCEYSAYTIT